MYHKSSSSSPISLATMAADVFRRYGKPGSSSPRPGLAGRKKGFRGAAIQAVAHLPMLLPVKVDGFGDTVIQVVVHHAAMGNTLTLGFGGTANQAIVHHLQA